MALLVLTQAASFSTQVTSGQGQHHGDNLGLVRLELDSVQLEEDGHGHEGDALVAVVEPSLPSRGTQLSDEVARM